VLSAIKGEQEAHRFDDEERELLSYPVARILVAAIGDQYLIKRFSLYESKWAYDRLREEDDRGLMAVGNEFGLNIKISPRFSDRKLELHFTDYLRYAAGFRDLDWKLINQTVINGKVYITKGMCARLVEEAIRDRVHAGLTGKVPEPIVTALEPHLAEIRESLDALKAERNMVADGEVSEDAFPPCMKALLSDLQRGTNLPHTARFALTSFLANIGLDKEQIMDLYRMAPDFREDMTRYQVEHITGGSGTEYTAPSCKTMMTYGNCSGKNPQCEWVTHPLSYYRKAMLRKARMQVAPPMPAVTAPDGQMPPEKPEAGSPGQNPAN
jgi:DNA primase large subunit